MITVHPLTLFFMVIVAFLAGVITMIMGIGWLMFRAYGVHQLEEAKKIDALGAALTRRMAWWIQEESWFLDRSPEMMGYFLDACVGIEAIQRATKGFPPRTLRYHIESLDVPESIPASKFIVRLLFTPEPKDL